MSQPGLRDTGTHVLNARYARQIVLKGFGVAGQQRLSTSRVLIVGAGGLGAPVAMYLAAAGVGALTLIDSDTVDESNLHRQLLYSTRDVGRTKLAAARDRLLDINPLVHIAVRDGRLERSNAAEVIAGHDVVIDATDNFPTRYAINDACLAAGIPFVYGSVARFEGQVTVFGTAGGPCYRCLFPDAPADGTVPSCAEEGVLGMVPGIIGLHQAVEATKLLAGIGTPLAGKLMLLDLLENSTRYITIHKRDDCPACSTRHDADATAADPGSTLPSPTHSDIVSTPPSNPPISFSTPTPQLSAAQLAARLAEPAPPTLLDVREQWEYDITHLPNTRLVPLAELQATVGSLDKNADYVVICHHGMRSEMAAQWLQAQGFSRVANLDGGIDGWSRDVDPSMKRY